MSKGWQYLERAVACRKMADQVRDAQHREQLESMAQEWEMLASERASAQASSRKRGSGLRRKPGRRGDTGKAADFAALDRSYTLLSRGDDSS